MALLLSFRFLPIRIRPLSRPGVPHKINRPLVVSANFPRAPAGANSDRSIKPPSAWIKGRMFLGAGAAPSLGKHNRRDDPYSRATNTEADSAGQPKGPHL